MINATESEEKAHLEYVKRQIADALERLEGRVRRYAAALDRNLLYVACTRAMHSLVVTYVGPLTRFIADASLYETRRP